MPRPAPRYQAPALDKGLDILELLADAPHGFTQTAIAQKLGRSVGELFRMLVALEARGYVCKRDDDAYELTLKLFDLSHRHEPSRRLLQAALGPMRAFADSTHQSVHLAVLYGKSIMVVANADSPAILGLTVRLGSQFSANDTASGRVLLAHWPEGKPGLPVKLEAPPKSRTERVTALRRRIELIRKRGYELETSLQIKGVTDISVPVFDAHGLAIAALTSPFLSQRDSPTAVRQTLDKLFETSRTISAALGGHAPVEGGHSV